MSRLLVSVSVLGVVLLGVTAGAMLAEAAVLVPYWRSLATWSRWQWARVGVGCAAFVASVLAIRAVTSPLD